MSEPKRGAEMTCEARKAHDELVHRLADVQCTLHCAAETFGDYDGMSDDRASAGVVVRRTVADLEALRDGFEAWEMKYAPLRTSDFEDDESGDV